MRPFQKNTIALSLCGTVLLAIAVSVTTLQMLQADVASDGLRDVRISAGGPLTVEAGGNIRLTAEGDYGTTTMPVRAGWSVGRGVPATIDDCRDAKQCTVTAGEDAGLVEVIAEAGGYRVAVSIEITETLKNPFKDEVPEWAASSIIRLHRAGIIKGYDNGRYGPADPVTHGQVITLLYRMLRSSDLIAAGKTGCNAYGDVRPGDYMEEAVCAFAAKGWGFDEPNFLPNDAASRGVVARFVAIVGQPLFEEASLDVESLADGPQAFDDVPRGDSFFTEVAIANALGVMTGYPTGDFGVRDSINRASMAVILERLLAQFNRAGMGRSASSSAALSVPVSSSSASRPTASASSSNQAIPCHDTDGGENLLEQGSITGTFHGQPDRAQAFKDECLSLSTVKEYFCDRGLYIGYTEGTCTGASRCRSGACTKVACEDTDGGQDFAVQGTVTVRNTNTGEAEASETDECVDYGKAIHQAEYYCGPDGRILNTGKVCTNGCADGVCLQASTSSTTAVSSAVASSSASSFPEPAAASSSQDTRTGKSGMFNLNLGLTYYDFSRETVLPFPFDPPYDIRVEKPGPLADQTKVWVYNGNGWISRIDPALQRTYPNVRKDDCIRQLQETRRFDDPKIGAGDTVCIDTDDGYIVKMTRHWSGESMQYERWPGEIDYTPAWDYLPEYQPGETIY